jgi:hypothetical protein
MKPPAMRRFAVAVLPAVLLLAGCASKEPPPCPPVGKPSPLDVVTLFEPGEGRDLTQVRFSGRIADVATLCEYDDDEVEIELAIRMVIERGPADRDRKVDLSYFVAVEDGPGNITAKEVFTVTTEFEGNSRRLGRVEELDLQIPVPVGRGFAQTRLLVGFQLTPEQLEYNRQRKQ